MNSTTQHSNTQLDRHSFTASAERYRRELRVHCYRMLGSFEESEDLVQETFLRAWRRRETFEGRSSLRAWLYKIATNACLDALDKRPRTVSSTGEVLWLQPYPDELLEELGGEGDDPEAAVVSKETIELAYLVAIQRLVPLQRAVLILRDVLGCSAKETADVLETSAPAVNSALQRARATMSQYLPEQRSEWPSDVDATAAERDLLERYIEYSETPDLPALKRLLSEDVRFSMPPQPGIWEGRDVVVNSWIEGGFGSEAFGSLRCVVTRANGQPAVANYVRKPGDDGYSPLALDVLRVVDGTIADIVTFDGSVFGWFGLPQGALTRASRHVPPHGPTFAIAWMRSSAPTPSRRPQTTCRSGPCQCCSSTNGGATRTPIAFPRTPPHFVPRESAAELRRTAASASTRQ